MAKYTKDQIETARESILRVLKPGDTIHSIVTFVSRDGMSRRIRFFVPRENGVIVDLTSRMATLIGARVHKDSDALIIGGAGMNMAFHAVYSLGRRLNPEGVQCAGERCASNDHTNDYTMKRDGTHWHRDGGYAYRQASL